MIAGLPLLAWPPYPARLTILIYHRVLLEPDPFRAGETTAVDFERQMRFLARYFQVLPLPEAGRRLQNGKLPHRACCITFDDGYSDNLTVALPILEKYRLPASVFVATGYLDGGRMFNDNVIDAIALSSKDELDLQSMGLDHYHLKTIDQKKVAIAAILEKLKYQPPDQRSASVEFLLTSAECGSLPNDIMLSSRQVEELSRRGIDIGGHTVAHTILSTLDEETATNEMLNGKRHLEGLIGKPVRTFAYPNGRPQRDYDSRHIAIARKLGFELAVSTSHGVANANSDLFQLPRFVPWGNSLSMLGTRLVRNAWTGKAAMAC